MIMDGSKNGRLIIPFKKFNRWRVKNVVYFRYWARNYVGWPKFGFFLPNSSHVALAEWERKGKVHWLITQNVDALHYKAGSKKVTELHGSAHRWLELSYNFFVDFIYVTHFNLLFGNKSQTAAILRMKVNALLFYNY